MALTEQDNTPNETEKENSTKSTDAASSEKDRVKSENMVEDRTPDQPEELPETNNETDQEPPSVEGLVPDFGLPPMDDWEKTREPPQPNSKGTLSYIDPLEPQQLEPENLSGQDLHDRDLSDQQLQGQDLSRANLQEANLKGADLRNANLIETNLSKANLEGADLRRANLRGANLKETDLTGADLRGSDLRDTNLQGAKLPGIPRYSDVSFRSQTVLGRTEPLRVAITRNYEPTNEQVLTPILGPPACKMDPIPVDVLVKVFDDDPDFYLEGSNLQTIETPLDEDSVPVLFKLTSKQLGPKILQVEFYQYGRLLGRVDLKTTVYETVQEMPLVSNQTECEIGHWLPSPDLTIRINYQEVASGKYNYQFTLFNSLTCKLDSNSRQYTQKTDNSPKVFLQSAYDQLNSHETPSQRLEGIGAWLYDNLFPAKLKDLYWHELRNKVENILFISDEALIPWELLLPANPQNKQREIYDFLDKGKDRETAGFLCVKYRLTRWLFGDDSPEDNTPPDTIYLDWLGLIMPVSHLESVEVEKAEIKQLFGNKTWEVKPVSREKVCRVLEKGRFSGLHFACHGEYDDNSPEWSTLFLEDGDTLCPGDLNGERLAFGEAHPLVFLNACETGQGGYTLTDLGGWVKKFINEARSSGFIGSIWQAEDESAAKFAVAFYKHLLEGMSIGEAVRLARLSIWRENDPTWLSYTVYANPLAKLDKRQTTQPQ